MTVPEQHDEALSEEYAQRRAAHPDGLTMGQRIRANRRSLELAGFILILFAINFLWTAHTAQRVTDAANTVVSKACDFWYPLTNLPVTIVTTTGKASQVSVKIIAGAREGYAGQCGDHGRPPLPPPDPSFIKWAAYYHVPVTP